MSQGVFKCQTRYLVLNLQIREAPRREWRGREGCARANAACRHVRDSDRLRASNHANQADAL